MLRLGCEVGYCAWRPKAFSDGAVLSGFLRVKCGNLLSSVLSLVPTNCQNRSNAIGTSLSVNLYWIPW